MLSILSMERAGPPGPRLVPGSRAGPPGPGLVPRVQGWSPGSRAGPPSPGLVPQVQGWSPGSRAGPPGPKFSCLGQARMAAGRNRECFSALVPSPDLTYERGSGDIRLIPRASLTLVILSGEKFLSANHIAENTICSGTTEFLATSAR